MILSQSRRAGVGNQRSLGNQRCQLGVEVLTSADHDVAHLAASALQQPVSVVQRDAVLEP
jgi:hypothetical protein